MEPDGIHLRLLKEPADVIVRLLSIFEQSWMSGEVPVEWMLVKIVPIFKKHRKGDPGNYRPSSLTSAPGKVMEKITLGGIGKHPEASYYRKIDKTSLAAVQH